MICGIGFRIAGHLSRHNKSRSHLLKTIGMPDSVSPTNGSPTEDLGQVMEIGQNGSCHARDQLPMMDTTPALSSPLISKPIPILSTESISTNSSQTTPEDSPIVQVETSGSRRFRCDVCDIGFRFQVKFYFQNYVFEK